jgi:hypothetical protein
VQQVVRCQFGRRRSFRAIGAPQLVVRPLRPGALAWCRGAAGGRGPARCGHLNSNYFEKRIKGQAESRGAALPAPRLCEALVARTRRRRTQARRSGVPPIVCPPRGPRSRRSAPGDALSAASGALSLGIRRAQTPHARALGPPSAPRGGPSEPAARGRRAIAGAGYSTIRLQLLARLLAGARRSEALACTSPGAMSAARLALPPLCSGAAAASPLRRPAAAAPRPWGPPHQLDHAHRRLAASAGPSKPPPPPQQQQQQQAKPAYRWRSRAAAWRPRAPEPVAPPTGPQQLPAVLQGDLRLSGTVRKCIFGSEADGYQVASIAIRAAAAVSIGGDGGGGGGGASSRGPAEDCTEHVLALGSEAFPGQLVVAGPLPGLHQGQPVNVYGRLAYARGRGWQLRAVYHELAPPQVRVWACARAAALAQGRSSRPAQHTACGRCSCAWPRLEPGSHSPRPAPPRPALHTTTPLPLRQDPASMAKYLATSLPGVGPGRAALLIKSFGMSACEVLDAQDAEARLREVMPGGGRAAQRRAVQRRRVAVAEQGGAVGADRPQAAGWLLTGAGWAGPGAGAGPRQEDRTGHQGRVGQDRRCGRRCRGCRQAARALRRVQVPGPARRRRLPAPQQPRLADLPPPPPLLLLLLLLPCRSLAQAAAVPHSGAEAEPCQGGGCAAGLQGLGVGPGGDHVPAGQGPLGPAVACQGLQVEVGGSSAGLTWPPGRSAAGWRRARGWCRARHERRSGAASPAAGERLLRRGWRLPFQGHGGCGGAGGRAAGPPQPGLRGAAGRAAQVGGGGPAVLPAFTAHRRWLGACGPLAPKTGFPRMWPARVPSGQRRPGARPCAGPVAPSRTHTRHGRSWRRLPWR